jgi:16S rRNA (uracil1498-N3)-methyltransferase
MAHRRFFVSQDRIHNGVAVLDPQQSHHLRAVLRLGSGAEIEIFDGQGCGYAGRVEPGGAEVRVHLLEKIDPARKPETALILAAALIKPVRFEWMLQKSTELGVSGIMPLITRFTGVRVPDPESRTQRWRRIVQEAAKQCRRLTVPEVAYPQPFAGLLGSPALEGQSRFLLHERAGERLQFIPEPGKSVLLCIGPEGGWDEEETRAAQDAGFRLIHMGPRILRAETAAIAAVAVFQFLLDE